MCPPLDWLQSCTHLELPLLQNVNKDGEKRRRAEEEGSKRCRKEAGRKTKNV